MDYLFQYASSKPDCRTTRKNGLNHDSSYSEPIKSCLILLFAWVIAILLRLLFKKGAAMFHLERKLVKWKMANSEPEADNKVNSIAKAIFYFVLLLFLPGVLGALQMEGISEPFSNALSTLLAFIPKLFAAALIVFIGWLIAKIVRDILTNFLKSIGTDKLGHGLD